jgi:predicted DsbA family dithiol-disulfide isomerase
MYDQLRHRGKEFGIVFGNRTLLPNSRLALEAAEYARDMGKYESFHETMFRFYFTETYDIGDTDVIKSVAVEIGLDTDDMMKAISEKRYRPRLIQARQERGKDQSDWCANIHHQWEIQDSRRSTTGRIQRSLQ